MAGAQPPTQPAGWRAWQVFFETHAAVFAALEQRLEAAFGLSLRRIDVLLHLSTAPDGLLMGELARRVVISKSGLTGLVGRMENDGLLARVPLAGNRRSVAVTLTPRGRALFEQAWLAHEHDVAELYLVHLRPTERRALEVGLTRVASALPR
jgi:DNA-binding MarR family transcriptional regulator